ncbi:MAG TPA: hypothetical protein VGD05_04365 [Pyrinomonadaceae bacterium]
MKKKENLKKGFQESKSEETFIETEEIDWEIFPAGDWFDNEEVTTRFFDHFRNLQNKGKWRNKFFDKSRIDGIRGKLNPKTYRTGKEEFEGYIVYFFDWTNKIILECPICGNATYVINSGKYSSQEIAKNSQLDTRTEYSDQLTVINHK